MRDDWMPFETLEHVYVGLVLEHLCKSLDCSCMAESLFDDIDIFVIDCMSNESYIVLDVVSHRLNTKEALPKFSRKLTFNHIGESLGSRGGKLRKPKMKTLFGVIATMFQTHAVLAVHFSPKTLGFAL